MADYDVRYVAFCDSMLIHSGNHRSVGLSLWHNMCDSYWNYHNNQYYL